MGIASREQRTQYAESPPRPTAARFRIETVLRKPPWTWPILLTLLGLALRLYRLGDESLWLDEGYSISNVNHLDPTAWAQNVRPVYYLVLRVWMRLGHSEFFLRLPSALFGAGTVLMIYLLGRKLIGERGSILASALMAISPLEVNHSQEIRMYSLVVLLTLAAMYEFVLLIEGRGGRHFVLYIAFGALGIATFPLTALILIPQALTVLLDGRRRGLRRWMLAEVALAAVCVPLFVNGMRYITYLTPESSTGVSALDVVRVVGEFALLTRGPAGSLTGYAFWAYTLITVALVCLGLARRKSRENEARRGGLLLAIWLVVPIALTAEIVRITGAQWLPRYVIYASPAYFLLIGLGIMGLPARRLGYLLAAAILLFPAIRLVRYYERPMHPQWREAVRFIQRNERPGDFIALYRPGNGVTFGYYYQGKSPWMEIGQPKLQRRKPWTEAGAAETVGDLQMRHRRVWLVMSWHDPDAGRAIESHVRRSAELLLTRSYAQIEVLLYARRSPLQEKTPPGHGSNPAGRRPI